MFPVFSLQTYGKSSALGALVVFALYSGNTGRAILRYCFWCRSLSEKMTGVFDDSKGSFSLQSRSLDGSLSSHSFFHNKRIMNVEKIFEL